MLPPTHTHTQLNSSLLIQPPGPHSPGTLPARQMFILYKKKKRKKSRGEIYGYRVASEGLVQMCKTAGRGGRKKCLTPFCSIQGWGQTHTRRLRSVGFLPATGPIWVVSEWCQTLQAHSHLLNQVPTWRLGAVAAKLKLWRFVWGGWQGKGC